MRTGAATWARTLVGPILWAIHFGGLYAIFSWMDLAEANAMPGRWIAGCLSLLCVISAVGAALLVRRDQRLDPGLRWIAVSGAWLAVPAILFQTLPVLLA